MPLRAADFESAAYAIPPLRAGPKCRHLGDTRRDGHPDRIVWTPLLRPRHSQAEPSRYAQGYAWESYIRRFEPLKGAVTGRLTLGSCSAGRLSLIHISEPTRLLSISYAV